MTCEDCIHFTDEKNTQFPDLARFHLCNVAKTPFWVEPECEICDGFEPKDNSWESVSK